ncbi:DUF2865 domain-containing protein [Methylosinus sp. H3A]|uniref:DUF2865 domain-containing protein n=1 Tax=Methylosinus sp. H3A TaxID=2785786 RepID=UPI0018C21D53|nr:DUF2865 domain-containing protein [Methylosinus sp. H3A]MBG0811476.1 DUF2865 domain-containing protein [Methylosinus sp. H3A]
MSSPKSGDRGISPRRRLAVLSGLILVFLIAALEPHSAFAQDFFQQLFGGGGGGYSDYGGAGGYYPSHRRHARAHARRQYAPQERRAEPQPHSHRRAAHDGEPERAVYTETAGGGRSYCVRECDGYFFPVGLYSSASDTASHQRACGRLCPGARTTLYVMRGGSDKIEDAVAARGGGSYSRLMASLQRKGEGEKDKECSCHAGQSNGGQSNESSIEAIYLDPTLRRGDAVMTTRGVEIFHGASRYPYSKNDFRPLARSPDLDEPIRRRLAALERASRHARGAVERRAARPVGEHRSQTSRPQD